MTSDQLKLSRPGDPARPGWRSGAITASALLAAVAVAWAAVPVSGASRGARPILIAAICCAVLAVGHLVIRPPGEDESLAIAPVIVRAWWQLTAMARAVPWAEGLVVAVLGLEALHRPRPWHTAVAGVMLLGYLFTTHLAETGGPARSLRPQLPLIAAGLGLLALVTAVAAVPAGRSEAAAWLRVITVAGTVIIGVLLVPV